MLKTFLITVALMVLSGNAMACPSQIVVLPDGRMMVCYYCNNGKLVNCENL
jgi:hypothetical protein